ncbi:LOG family protein [Spirosoma validum]|uniref:Cytokinin riboside 5'-monophosphate phosphoribohydrolase n=1 Tax=Spirosoma validum TaxID=2771355 RepID=A0A927AY51_9BACT|nr:TIGR00730 family Rossman fold protein [Spirosoma validum]MBD2751918.1 TIGR00730 family Rossman fold protein [Spirosoma validum]
MKRIAVFCGSSPGNDPAFMELAYQLGQQLATGHIGLVYGGAKVGLMGAVADGALSLQGEVVGVLPTFLQTKEIAHEGLTELILVESMHQRKTKMHELSDGVITLPGGYGTLEEYFEVLTWGQLGLHKKPIALLNINGYYDGLLTLADTMVANGLLKQVNRDMMLISNTIEDLLQQMHSYTPPTVGKWLTPEKT